MRILICDDEGIVQQAIRFMIQKSFGDEFEIESAKNGRMAIELAESFRPDIILMDIQMPGINGIEAMEEIKREHKNIIFIVLQFIYGSIVQFRVQPLYCPYFPIQSV